MSFVIISVIHTYTDYKEPEIICQIETHSKKQSPELNNEQRKRLKEYRSENY